MRIRVLVANSQRLFAETLAVSLAGRPELSVIKRFPTTGVEAIAAARDAAPDVALLDYWLEGIEAPNVIRSILAKAPEVKIINLSWLSGPDHINAALAAGAVGFLPTGVTVARVVEAVRRAHAGEHPVFEEELDDLVMRIENRRRFVELVDHRLETLTPRELEVLTHMGGGLARDEIADRLGISLATVRTHIHRILEKTKARSQMEAVAMARDHGFIP
jgi:two-component system, NarL family, response regulator DesR